MNGSNNVDRSNVEMSQHMRGCEEGREKMGKKRLKVVGSGQNSV